MATSLLYWEFLCVRVFPSAIHLWLCSPSHKPHDSILSTRKWLIKWLRISLLYVWCLLYDCMPRTYVLWSSSFGALQLVLKSVYKTLHIVTARSTRSSKSFCSGPLTIHHSANQGVLRIYQHCFSGCLESHTFAQCGHAVLVGGLHYDARLKPSK